MSQKKTSARRRSSSALRPRVKVWFEIENAYVFGHGINEMLRAVQRAGSIKRAAESLDKSYRYVWGRIKEAESALGRSLVTTTVGGAGVQRSALTPLAERLSADFDRLRTRVMELVEREFSARCESALDD